MFKLRWLIIVFLVGVLTKCESDVKAGNGDPVYEELVMSF